MEIELQTVTKRYGRTAALQGVSATLRPGGIIGLVGPNGAGKSTLIRQLTTLERPTSGQILLDGTDIVAKPLAMRRVLGYLPQQVPYEPALDARGYLRYLAALRNLPSKAATAQIDSLLVALHLGDVGRKKLADFSGGMRQRVGIAAALLGDPQVIVVDEPTTGLDPVERVGLRNLLSELAQTRLVIVSTHIVSDIEAVAGQLLLLRHGQLVFNGTPGALLTATAGHVWEMPIEPGGTVAPDAALIQTADGLRVRVIAAQQPAAVAEAVAPRLEDACLAVMEGKVDA
ncbi:ATP-binding cassette domain-containing protein [Lacticaseibacillus mingshuiensis]|uniref:ATP-binding cassette domain-containing protein n=1 Tax=Lacticaseibacillus mingshuiensis TaxID=2799574 RepID=A0ABW4CN86_9LACO|nr:ATP-binding cassette domain-containing protein [Lacticaseibacillus mingshuiensis]